MVLVEYTRDITKERNDKEVTLQGKETYSEEERHHLQTPYTQKLQIKIAPTSNEFPAKVGWMSYPMEECHCKGREW